MAGRAGNGRAGNGGVDKRRLILDAAIRVFARRGFHACRVSDVADEAGVAYGLVYHYFKNKDELLETVFETGWSGFVSRIRGMVAFEGVEKLIAQMTEDVARTRDVLRTG